MIRDAKPDDSEAIADIYNYYINNTIVTFETESVSSNEMSQRISETLSHDLPYLVYEESDEVIGYAYASPWKGRCAYRYSVEVTVYLAHNSAGKGLGTQLYQALFARLKSQGYHTAIGGISLPNPASVGLHEKMGMEKVVHFKEVGFKFDQWVDVGYWQKALS